MCGNLNLWLEDIVLFIFVYQDLIAMSSIIRNFELFLKIGTPRQQDRWTFPEVLQKTSSYRQAHAEFL